MGYVNTIRKVVGSGGASSGDYLVRFIDFDGTILKQQWVNAGQAATAPTPPTHQYLTFEEWNNDFTNVQHDLDVGATYYTTDGKTYLFMRFTNTTGLQPSIYLNKATTAQMNIDWGDGTGASLSGSGNITITKAAPYAAIGDYIITIECAGNYRFYTYIFNNNANYNSCLLRCYLSESVTSITSFAFYHCYSLTFISLPKSITSTGSDSQFCNCFSLKAIIVPKSITDIPNYTFQNCHTLKIISLPDTLVSINSRVFENCYSLESIILPSTLTLIGYQTFKDCYSLISVKSTSESLIWNGSYTFDRCHSLKQIIGFNITNIMTQCFCMCYSLETLSIPLDTTNMSTSTLYECMSLKSIVVPHAVINIGLYAFSSCYGLLKYQFLATTPPTLASTTAFQNINIAAKIYVPDASVSAYQAATNWVTYASYIYPISELAEYAGTIFFQCNGGNAIKQIKGTAGAVATAPTAPTKAGVTFAGWYKEEALTNAWNWATDVYPDTNLTLYAKWI